MECRDCQSQIDLYLAGMLSTGEIGAFTEHINTCQHCREKVNSNKFIDELIMKCDVPIPRIDITKAVMDKIRSKSKVAHRQNFTSLLQDIVAAAAAAIIIFWFSGSMLTGAAVPQYSQKVTEVSNSVGVVFEAYLNFYDQTIDKFSKSVYEFDRWK